MANPRRFGVLLLALAALGLRPLPAQQTSSVFRAGVRTVAIYATVRDRDGRLVPDLPRDTFEILDNGRRTPVTVFSNEIQPLTVALLLDMSGSMMPAYTRVREGTLGFIEALLPDDRVRIGSFGAEIALSPFLTGDKATLRRIAREELWPSGGTPMWNTVNAAMVSLARESGRRVVLVLTDGFDTGGLEGWKGTAADARYTAVHDSFMVYAIGVASMLPLQADLIDLTEETGGGHLTVSETEDLTQTFARVADELRHQYVLGFTPEVVDDREHKLQVRARPGMNVRTRKSYVAQR